MKDFVRLQGHHNSQADAAFILGELLAIVHQARYGNELFILGVVYAVILDIFNVEIGIEIGLHLGKMALCKDSVFLGIFNNAVIKIGVLESDRGIKIAYVIVGGHLSKLIVYEGVARLIKAFDVLPKIKAHSHVFILQDRVSSDNGRSYIVSSECSYVWRGHI